MTTYFFEGMFLGLNPYDRDLLLTKFELVRDSFCNELDVNFSMLKSEPNQITLKYYGDSEKALELFHICTNIDFSKSDYDRFDATPSFICKVECVNDEYGV